jgi:putative MFS transporter
LDTLSQFQRAIPERLDRLPLSREIWRILFLAGVAWLIESYDIGVIGSVLPLLKENYQVSGFASGLLASASTLGIVVAIVPAGWLTDRVGRKRVLWMGTAWYASISLLCGFAPNVNLLIVLRFISGLGMGAVFPIPYAMAAEFVSHRYRGAMTAVLDSFLSFGYFLVPLLALAFIPHMTSGQSWRILLYLGGIPLLYVPVLLKWMPESPRWLQSQGRTEEADRVVAGLERAIKQRAGALLPEVQIAQNQTVSPPKAASPRILFQRSYKKRTLMMWVSFACILFIFYAIQTYTPTVLLQEGYGFGSSFLLTSIIVLASVPGKWVAGFTVERWGRKITLISFTIIAALSALVFGVSHTASLALLAGCVMSFFGIGVDPVIKIYGAEQYPTHLRETGVSLFEGVGRLFGGVLAPWIMSFMLTSTGIPGSYVFVAVLALVGALVVCVLGVETRGQQLEKAAGDDILVLAEQEKVA